MARRVSIAGLVSVCTRMIGRAVSWSIEMVILSNCPHVTEKGTSNMVTL
jgi:TRAP-type mannitol/chloroaromatic compound transport system permease small subunit